MQKATLLFLIDGEMILLAMKKRGFGAGHWNGVGGKPDPGETIEQTAIRECEEEIGVTPLSIKRVGNLVFNFEGKTEWDQEVVVFLCDSWQGEPEETEEMRPKWFALPEIPYEQMWEDDKFWLPEVLDGKTVDATFTFDASGKLAGQDVSSR